VSSVYGCYDHQPYPQVYFATGGREPIRHVTTRECQFTKSNLGREDPGCIGCKHRLEQLTEKNPK
jgi:hypothetical protein